MPKETTPSSLESAAWAGPLLSSFVSPVVRGMAGLNQDPKVTAVNGFIDASYKSALFLNKDNVMNVIIICRKTGDRSAEWFMDSFESKSRNKRNAEEEKEYQKRVKSVASRPNRKSGKDLEGILLDIVDKTSKNSPPTFYFQG